MKNKKLSNLIHQIKRLTAGVIRYLFNKGNTAAYDRPTHRGIHLNSSAAIRIWLSMVDRPIDDRWKVYYIGGEGDIYATGGGMTRGVDE